MAEETTIPQDHAVAIMIDPTNGRYVEPDQYRAYFEQIQWCRGETVTGSFHSRVVGTTTGLHENAMPGFVLFTFSDPDAAFAFKMRWA